MRTLLIYSLFVSVLVFETNSKPMDPQYTIGSDGVVSMKYGTKDGVIHEGPVNIVKDDTETIPVVIGYYNYIGSDGKEYEVRYFSDDQEFIPLKRINLKFFPATFYIGHIIAGGIASIFNNKVQPYLYETRDGTLREETVKVSNKSLKNEQIVISGFYSYLDPKGTKHYVSYISDDRGFRPTVFFGEILLEPHISSVAIGTLQGGGLG